METLIITSSSNQGLNDKIKSYTEQGYRVVGTHQVVETHHQNRFRQANLESSGKVKTG